ncbi:MAG: amidohydrolase family protein [Phycisphaerae bacterium]
MIIDCHTSIWQSPEQLGRDAIDRIAQPIRFGREQVRLLPKADTASHWLACAPVDVSLVLGFKSRYLGAHIPNELLTDYCSEHASRVIGFAGVDPTESNAIAQLTDISRNPFLKGLVICPAAQDCHPCDTQAMRIYEAAAALKLPVFFSSGPYLAARTRLEYARPLLLDEVARSFPELKLIISHFGYPWVDETLTLLAKHTNVFSCIAGLLRRPWLAWDALLRAYQLQVTGQVLFGSDFPFSTAADCIETLFHINEYAMGSQLPVIPRETLRHIVQNDALVALGIHSPPDRTLPAPASIRRSRSLSK